MQFMRERPLPSESAQRLFASGALASCSVLRVSFGMDEKSAPALMDGLLSNPSEERALWLSLHVDTAPHFTLAVVARSEQLSSLTALRVDLTDGVRPFASLAKQLKDLRRLEVHVKHQSDDVCLISAADGRHSILIVRAALYLCL